MNKSSKAGFLVSLFGAVSVITAPAWYTVGHVRCDANLDGTNDAGDKPVQSAMVVVTNLSGTFSNYAWTEASGLYIAELPPVADTYVTYVHPLTLPTGTTQIVPLTASFQLTATIVGATNNFLISNPVCVSGAATIHYVNAANPTPVAPYTSWPTAATNIQDAIDVAAPGATILVTNGVYGYGGRVIHGQLTNRVAIYKPVQVRSVNGPAVTLILGTRAGEIARCAYLTNGATLSGFTLTNGRTLQVFVNLRDLEGAGAWCESTNTFLTNCIVTTCNAAGNGGGSYSGTLSACLLTNNQALLRGGGVYEAAVSNSTIIANASEFGGGAYSSSLVLCSLYTNQVAGRDSRGGGAAFSTLVNCLLQGNSAGSQLGGGGAANSTLTRCTLTGNSATATGGGGGAYECTLNWCFLAGNSAFGGGGASGSTLEDCLIVTNLAAVGGGLTTSSLTNSTVAFNTASDTGGGLWRGSAYNSIVYNNSAPAGSNYFDAAFFYSCTAPLSPGPGNISTPPLFMNPAAGNFRLQPDSPCIDAGNNAYVHLLTDLEGRPRIVNGIVDMGAYEHQGPSGSPPVPTLLPARLDSSGLMLTWLSVPGYTYTVERTASLSEPAAFTVIQSNIAGQLGTTSYTDTSVNAGATFFYRVRVE